MPRPLNEQTVVLTGASSGIGREAALLLGQRGANVVLAARDPAALDDVARQVEEAGGRALAMPTDVADWPEVERLADRAVERFGRIDTWINNAGVTIGGTVADTPVDEIERLVRVNLLGPIHGVKAALPHMRRQGQGAFINVASVAGVRAFPLQTTYCATKHGLVGFSEGLRLELHREPGEFHVTVILPASINTPLFRDARSEFGREVSPPPPVYEPEVVAESIVFAAEHPRRDIFCGGGGKLFDVLQRISPGFVDWYMGLNDQMFRAQISDRPAAPDDNLFDPPAHPRTVHGEFGRQAKSTSLYTKVFEWHPILKPIALGAAALGALALLRGTDGHRRDRWERVRDRAEEAINTLK